MPPSNVALLCYIELPTPASFHIFVSSSPRDNFLRLCTIGVYICLFMLGFSSPVWLHYGMCGFSFHIVCSLYSSSWFCLGLMYTSFVLGEFISKIDSFSGRKITTPRHSELKDSTTHPYLPLLEVFISFFVL